MSCNQIGSSDDDASTSKDSDAFGRDRRNFASSIRYRGRTKRRIYKEEETLATCRTSVQVQASQQLTKSMKDLFRGITAMDLPENTGLPILGSEMEMDDDGAVTIGFTGSNSIEDYSESKDNIKRIIKSVIETEFPKNNNIPTARDIINVGKYHENKARYEPGSWVEIEGLDMKWRLDMITKIVRQAPDDWDWNDPKNEEIEPKWVFHYHAGIERKFREEDIRSPEEGLKKIFGNRPWVWQQWAIIKLEEKIRFQEGHQYDCMEMDVQKYAADLWDEWLGT